MKFFLSLILVSTVLFSCTSKFGKVLKSTDKEYKLKMAEQYYAAQKYDLAQQVYEDIMPFFKGDARFEDIFYKYSYCAYYDKDYLNAENLFKSFTETFPNSTRAEEAEYMRAMSYYKQSPKVELDQTNTMKTMALMQAFINTHPGSSRIKDATEIIDQCRAKLESKEEKSAQLYYNLGYFKSAAVAFEALNNSYPDSEKSDVYKLKEIKSYIKYAEMSVPQKQTERYEKVITEINEFNQRFSDSELLTQVNEYKTDTEQKLKNLQNEQTTETTGR